MAPGRLSGRGGCSVRSPTAGWAACHIPPTTCHVPPIMSRLPQVTCPDLVQHRTCTGRSPSCSRCTVHGAAGWCRALKIICFQPSPSPHPPGTPPPPPAASSTTASPLSEVISMAWHLLGQCDKWLTCILAQSCYVAAQIKVTLSYTSFTHTTTVKCSDLPCPQRRACCCQESTVK